MSKNFIFFILAIIASSLIILFFLEITLRLLGYETAFQGYERIGVEYIREPYEDIPYVYPAYGSFSQHYSSNPNSYFSKFSNGVHYKINNYGFRDSDFFLSRNESVRIAFLGDSFCFGNGNKDNDIYSNIIERRLNSSSKLKRNYEIYNFCLGSYSTKNEAALYEKVVSKFNPDILVVWYFLNDIDYDNSIETQSFFRRGFNENKQSFFYKLRDNLVTFDLAFKSFASIRNHKELINYYRNSHKHDSLGFKSVDNALNKIEKISEINGTKTFLTIFPIIFKLSNEYPFKNEHKRIMKLSNSHNFITYDLFEALSDQSYRDLWVHPTDQHPNYLAHRLVGEYFFSKFENYLIKNEYKIKKIINPITNEKEIYSKNRNWILLFNDER
jgi:hypothetical protein